MMNARPTIRVVKDAALADPDAICVTLFEEDGRLMAWFIGPIDGGRSRDAVPYLPRSRRTSAAAALVAAMGRAIVDRRDICVVDPHDLWATV